MKAVAVENLTKIYTPGKSALKAISFSLDPGEIFGFLGPNGAGKTHHNKTFGWNAHTHKRHLSGF